jgi:DsbC/DsbD-like thiol-disulfide interchange protein
MLNALAIGAACAVLVAVPAGAQRGKPAPHARVMLMADGGRAGAPLTIGVRFQIDPDWHIYWRNPGGSGSPPAIRWAPVPGLKMSDIQWPVPTRIHTDAIVSYGYAREVMLLVPAQRAGAAANALTLAATVDYVICRDLCVKETATATIALPAAATMPVRSPDAALFDQAQARLPKRAPPDWTVTARAGTGTITLRVATQMPFHTAVFFPFVNGLIDDAAAQRADVSAQGLALQMPKSPYFSRAPAVLEGVLVIDGGQAFTVKAPFAPGK